MHLSRVKPVYTILLCLLCSQIMQAQYYLRGEIKDETNKPLANAKILLHSNGYVYYTGNSGGFGITTKDQTDSITVTVEGYQQQRLLLQSSRYEYVVLKMLQGAGNTRKNRLMSVTKDRNMADKTTWTVGGETYSNLLENDFVPARRFPETGFAVNTDKASYSNIRRFINMNSAVPPDAVRIEEMLNYFNFGYKEPEKDSVFSFSSYATQCPWNADNQLLYLKVCARKVDLEKVPPSNLVFLIDVSGSMDMPNRLPLLKSAFRLMVNNLRDKDTVSIVVYGGAVGVWMQPTSGSDKEKILKSIEELQPGGATPGESGIKSAYRLAQSQFIKGGNNRVILATDGDFNVGQTNEEELEKMITAQRQLGIYLTCLGVGMGNYKDSKLEALAKKGNGNFAYLDDEKEAEKVLVKELTQTLYSVADDVYMNINFNAAFVKDYRLIGFDNKLNAVADSLSELEGGEVGSGHTLLALFEMTPTLTNEHTNHDFANREKLATIRFNFKTPHDSAKKQTVYAVPFQLTPFNELPACHRFATAVVMFGSLLKDSKYTKAISWNDAIIMANESLSSADVTQKEFLTLVEKAKKIYNRGKKKREG